MPPSRQCCDCLTSASPQFFNMVAKYGPHTSTMTMTMTMIFPFGLCSTTIEFTHSVGSLTGAITPNLPILWSSLWHTGSINSSGILLTCFTDGFTVLSTAISYSKSGKHLLLAWKHSGYITFKSDFKVIVGPDLIERLGSIYVVPSPTIDCSSSSGYLVLVVQLPQHQPCSSSWWCPAPPQLVDPLTWVLPHQPGRRYTWTF